MRTSWKMASGSEREATVDPSGAGPPPARFSLESGATTQPCSHWCTPVYIGIWRMQEAVVHFFNYSLESLLTTLTPAVRSRFRLRLTRKLCEYFRGWTSRKIEGPRES